MLRKVPTPDLLPIIPLACNDPMCLTRCDGVLEAYMTKPNQSSQHLIAYMLQVVRQQHRSLCTAPPPESNARSPHTSWSFFLENRSRVFSAMITRAMDHVGNPV